MATVQTGAGDPVRSMKLLWGSPAPTGRPGPRPRLTAGEIVDAAVALVEREGLDKLSMRTLAAELGVGPMTLYRYVPGKGELLDLMIDTVSAPPPDPPDTSRMDWREVLELVAEGYWSLYTRHPWILEVNQRRLTLGPGALAGYELALTAFDEFELPDYEVNMILNGISALTTGVAFSTLIPAGEHAVDDEEWSQAVGPYLDGAVATGRFPRVAQVDHESAWESDPHRVMRYALDAFLDGVEPRMAAARKS